MRRALITFIPFLSMLLLEGCATSFPITEPDWPAIAPDEVSVRQSLKDLVKTHPSLKVVLRVPNVTTNVTQSQGSQSSTANEALGNAYDIIEKKLFNAGFVVRDRALLSSLIDKEGITSYKEIQSRVDTDLIIDVSSLHFNLPQDWATTKNFKGQDGQMTSLGQYSGYSMGQAVATVEAKFIIVETGEVGAIVTLRVPVCEHISCTYDYFDDGMGDTNLSMSSTSKYAWVYDQNSQTLTYLWGQGSGPGSMNQAAELIAQKIVDVLKQ